MRLHKLCATFRQDLNLSIRPSCAGQKVFNPRNSSLREGPQRGSWLFSGSSEDCHGKTQRFLQFWCAQLLLIKVFGLVLITHDGKVEWIVSLIHASSHVVHDILCGAKMHNQIRKQIMLQPTQLPRLLIDWRNPRRGQHGKKSVINSRKMSQNALWHFMTLYDASWRFMTFAVGKVTSLISMRERMHRDFLSCCLSLPTGPFWFSPNYTTHCCLWEKATTTWTSKIHSSWKLLRMVLRDVILCNYMRMNPNNISMWFSESQTKTCNVTFLKYFLKSYVGFLEGTSENKNQQCANWVHCERRGWRFTGRALIFSGAPVL